MDYFLNALKLSLRFIIILLLVCSIFFLLGNKEREKVILQLDGLRVPKGFVIERVVDPGMIAYPMFASFDSDGRLFVFESDGSSPTNEEC